MVIYRYRGGRLEGFGVPGASPETWKRVWEDVDLKERLDCARRGGDRIYGLSCLMSLFSRWLPRPTDGVAAPILEAGCGTGHVAVALHAGGYRALGLDFSHETLAAATSLAPECPFVAGNVFSLPFRDRSVAAYLSLGVVEHYREGPLPILKEAHRVLQDGGVLLISVPYFHPLRKLRTLVGSYRPNTEQQIGEMPFWEYVYSPREFGGWLQKAGFAVRQTFPLDALEGGWRDLRGFKRVVARLRRSQWGQALLSRWAVNPVARWFCGQMVLFVARKA